LRVHGRHHHLKAVSTTLSGYTLSITQSHRRNRIVYFLPSDSNLSGISVPDMLTPPYSLASAHPCTCETSYNKRNEQEHSYAEATDGGILQEARIVDQKAGKAAHLKTSQSS
jgi:hypothetical protein